MQNDKQSPIVAQNRASFADFDRSARAGGNLNVVFFGASLTWGANSTDPQLKSYRALVADHLQEAYPKAHWRFWDAAIGGTTSQLGIFRLDRDVLAHNPDLVFLDFSLNDDLLSADQELLASYEAIVRRLVLTSVPVVQVLFPYKSIANIDDLGTLVRRTAHLRIAHEYGTAVGDAVALVRNLIRGNEATDDGLWSDPNDSTHPTDEGYAVYARAAWQGLQEAIAREQVCAAPKLMLHADTYMHTNRVRLSTVVTKSAGWANGRPNRISCAFDFMMSRWLDDEVIASRPGAASPETLTFTVFGSAILLFGEGTPSSGHYRVRIDNGPWSIDYDAGSIARPSHGNSQHWQVLAHGLAPSVPHVLELHPVLLPNEELRFESLCIAGCPDANQAPLRTANRQNIR